MEWGVFGFSVVSYFLQWHNLTEIIRKIRNLGTFSCRENPKDYYYNYFFYTILYAQLLKYF